MEKVDENEHDRVDTALANWKQGDCVIGEQWFVHRIAACIPLTEEAAYAAEAGGDLAEAEVRGFVVLSQTCDIVRSCAERPYLEIAPLVEVEDGDLRAIERSRRPRYAFIPALGSSNLVGDLDRVMTVEKAVAVAWQRREGCTTDRESRRFAQALARKRARFAFPDDFTSVTGKLQNRMQGKHDRQSIEGEALRALREIRVRAAPSWDDDSVEILFWFIRNENQPNFNGRGWDKLLEDWLKLVPAKGRFSSVDGVVITLDDMTAREYVESDPLDLDHLSSR